jgi:hypothetical protein
MSSWLANLLRQRSSGHSLLSSVVIWLHELRLMAAQTINLCKPHSLSSVSRALRRPLVSHSPVRLPFAAGFGVATYTQDGGTSATGGAIVGTGLEGPLFLLRRRWLELCVVMRRIIEEVVEMPSSRDGRCLDSIFQGRNQLVRVFAMVLVVRN